MLTKRHNKKQFKSSGKPIKARSFFEENTYVNRIHSMITAVPQSLREGVLALLMDQQYVFVGGKYTQFAFDAETGRLDWKSGNTEGAHVITGVGHRYVMRYLYNALTVIAFDVQAKYVKWRIIITPF